ncbi:DUF1573 domain-containing protein, partial [bacterium]|nr:DUF1573 domain-containing protein [candidate division CSSED10-310 bacterium]
APVVSLEDSTSAQPESTGITIDPPEFDFGRIPYGRLSHHEFTVTNHSDSPRFIRTIRSDCGCTAEFDTSSPLDAGSSRTLKISYEPEYLHGDIKKRITLHVQSAIDDTPIGWIEIILRASIVSVFTLDPSYVYFKKTTLGHSAEEIVTIRTVPGETAQIIDVRSPSSHISPTWVKQQTEAGSPESWTLTIRLNETAPAGRLSETLTIVTDAPHQPEIPLDVLGFIASNVTIRPTQSYLGTLMPGDTIQRTFTVKKSGDTADLKTPTVTGAPPGVEITIKTIDENRSYEINVTFTIPENSQGRFSGSFTIVTGDASLPEFEVPFFGYILPPDTPQPPSPLHATGD